MANVSAGRWSASVTFVFMLWNEHITSDDWKYPGNVPYKLIRVPPAGGPCAGCMPEMMGSRSYRKSIVLAFTRATPSMSRDTCMRTGGKGVRRIGS